MEKLPINFFQNHIKNNRIFLSLNPDDAEYIQMIKYLIKKYKIDINTDTAIRLGIPFYLFLSPKCLKKLLDANIGIKTPKCNIISRIIIKLNNPQSKKIFDMLKNLK